MLPEHLPDINLLPHSDRRKSSILYQIFLVVLLFIVVLSAIMIFLYFKTNSDIKKANSQIESLEAQSLALQKGLNRAQAEQADPFVLAAQFADQRRLPASIMLSGLMSALPENSYLSEFNYNLGEVKITTEFETLQKASIYMEDLQELDYIHAARVESVESFNLKEEEIEDIGLTLPSNRYNVLPRYRVNYTFNLDEAALEAVKKKEAEKNE